MKRVMCVWLMTPAIDLLRLKDKHAGAPPADGRPVIIAVTASNRRLVHDRCRRAERSGVQPGMPLAQALAVLRAPRVVERVPRRERALLRALAQRMLRFSPVVAPEPPDALLVDIAGCEHLFGGEAPMLARVRAQLARWGLTARVSVAPSPALAWALARFAHDAHLACPNGQAAAALAPLPLAALRLEPKAHQALAELRVERVEQLVALGRTGVARRFGLQVLLRLDQALGLAHHWTEAIVPERPLRCAVDFEGPTTRTETVQAAARAMLCDLCAQLLARGLGASELTMSFARCDLEPVELGLTLTRPSAAPAHLWRLLRDRVASLHMGFGVEGVRARAFRTAPLRTRQGTLEQGDRANGTTDEPTCEPTRNQRWHELLDALATRLGPARVCTLERHDSHDPARCVRRRSVLDAPDAHPAPHPAPHATPHPAPHATPHLASCPARQHRPSQLFEPALPAQVIAATPDGPIHVLRWRDHAGPVLTCVGPERIEGEWWRVATPHGLRAADGQSGHDYFKIQDDRGVWLWVSRALDDGRWSVRGAWA